MAARRMMLRIPSRLMLTIRTNGNSIDERLLNQKLADAAALLPSLDLRDQSSYSLKDEHGGRR